MSSLTAERCEAKQQRIYTIVIDDIDFAMAEFDDRDLALLRDCEGDDRTVSDRLLALEMIARRIEEAIK